jgi:hypothetical protein
VTTGLDVVAKIAFKGNEFGRPSAEVKITDCGVL